ncbi:MAG: hypothetical protein NVSMB56_17800 [Pyrinomonadaceae bacterium]
MAYLSANSLVKAQTKDEKPKDEKQSPATKPSKKEDAPAKLQKDVKIDRSNLTAEQVAEAVIYVYGSRPGLEQIRKTGLERGKTTRVGDDGRTEEFNYERRFVRGDKAEKDKIRVDQKAANSGFALIYNDKRIFGIINGTTFTPRQQAVNELLAQTQHSLDTLLRYKENDSTLNLIGKEKQKGLELWVLDVTDKDKRTTRFYISALKFRVLSLGYEEGTVKFKRAFHDYRTAQGTLVPYRTVLSADGKQLSETNLFTVSYGVKMDDTLFRTAESSTAAN